MKNVLSIFLQIILIFVSLLIFCFLLVFPHFEGRNIGASFFEIYFTDPILLYVYFSSIPFFIAIYQVYTILSSVRKNTIFSFPTVKTLQILFMSAFIFGICITLALPYIFMFAQDDDAPGVILIGLFFLVGSFAISVVAALCRKMLLNVLALKSENDLTV